MLVALRFEVGFVVRRTEAAGVCARAESILAIATVVLRQMAWSEILIALRSSSNTSQQALRRPVASSCP